MEELLFAVLPDLWRAIPAAVLALLVFGLKRSAVRVAGVFAKLDEIESTLDQSAAEAVVASRLIEAAHQSLSSTVVEHAAQARDDRARIERALDVQGRRIDAIYARRSD